MVTYPIRIKRRIFRGADAKKRMQASEYNSRVERLEKTVNEVVAKQERRTQPYTWAFFTEGSGLSIEQVREIGHSIDCGHNGFTVVRPELPE